jgi:Fe2+ transport system protein FeoA
MVFLNDMNLDREIASQTACSKNPGSVCPLSLVRAGVAVRIKQLLAAPDVTQRLREIGLGEEQTVRLVASKSNFICQVCNARLAISSELARAILVEPVTLPFAA